MDDISPHEVMSLKNEEHIFTLNGVKVVRVEMESWERLRACEGNGSILVDEDVVVNISIDCIPMRRSEVVSWITRAKAQ